MQSFPFALHNMDGNDGGDENQSKFRGVILAAASYTRLLTEIADLEWVPSAKERQTIQVEDFKRQLARIQEEVKQLVEETNKRKKKHDSLLDSTMERTAYKLLGNTEQYEAKLNEADKKYVEVSKRQAIARKGEAASQELLKEASKELMNLSVKELRLYSAKAELTALFERVLDGPTGFSPEEDRLKDAFSVAKKHHDEIQTTFDSETRALEELDKAVTSSRACQTTLQVALKFLQSAWANDYPPAEVMNTARHHAVKVDVCVSEAIQASPRVKSIRHIDIPTGYSTSTRKIEPVYTQVARCNRELQIESSSARLRVDAASKQLLEASGALDRCRKELREFRKVIFESCIEHSKIWQSVLVKAKNNMRRHAALVEAFPKREKMEAMLILTDTIAKYKEDNKLDEKFAPDRDMSIVMLSNEQSIFRGQMKEVAREVVKSKYCDVLFPPDPSEHEMVKDSVLGILSDGSFLRGGVDENGKTQNLGHPSIEALALQFYYTGDDCLANLFPEDFENTIPERAFALLITCIQHCIEEYADHGYRLDGINFEGHKYRNIYQNSLDMVTECKKNEYHGPRFQNRCAEWAHRGMQQLKKANSYTPTLCLD